MYEIKPCPFCGNKVEINECKSSHTDKKGKTYYISHGFYIECETCNYQMGHNQDYNYYGDATAEFLTTDDAIKYFNTRLEPGLEKVEITGELLYDLWFQNDSPDLSDLEVFQKVAKALREK